MKKFFKWLGIIVLVLVLAFGAFVAYIVFDSDVDEGAIDRDISSLYEELKPGMYLSESRELIKKYNNSNIGQWHQGDDGAIPLAKGYVKEDKSYCVYTGQRAHEFMNGDIMYYATKDTDLIGFTINGDTCYGDNVMIKSIYLMGSDGDVFKKKTLNEQFAKTRVKLEAAMLKAKKEDKRIMVVLFNPNPTRFDKDMEKLIKKDSISKMINEKVIYMDYHRSIGDLGDIGFIGRLRGYPAIVFLDKNGKTLYQSIIGTPEEKELKSALQSIGK